MAVADTLGGMPFVTKVFSERSPAKLLVARQGTFKLMQEKDGIRQAHFTIEKICKIRLHPEGPFCLAQALLLHKHATNAAKIFLYPE
jgi:hypothetical protein